MDLVPGPSTTGSRVLDWRPMVSAILDDLHAGQAVELVAARFHQGIVDGLLLVARAAGLPRVVLTGGCFQNGLLVALARRRLETAGFTVYTHRQVPSNDGGLSLGQAVVAAVRTD